MKTSYKVGSVKQFIDIEGLNEEDEVIRKQSSEAIQINSDAERCVVALISSSACDADGDMIDPEGCDFKRFMSNPVIHKNHSYKVEDVIGKALEVKSSPEGIVAKIQFADTPNALDVWNLVKGGYVKANSIGFITKESIIKGTDAFTNFIKEKGWKVADSCRRIIKRFELIESSIVSIPCNPEALMQAISAKSIELSEKTIKELDLPKVEPVIVAEKVEVVKKQCPCEDCEDPENCTCLGEECESEECNCSCHDIKEEEQAALKVKQAEEEAARLKKIEESRVWKVIRNGGIEIDKKLIVNKKLGKII